MRKSILALVLICAFAEQTRSLTPGDLSRVTFEQHPGVQISTGCFALPITSENNRPSSFWATTDAQCSAPS
jgi:hypothetical protein